MHTVTPSSGSTTENEFVWPEGWEVTIAGTLGWVIMKNSVRLARSTGFDIDRRPPLIQYFVSDEKAIVAISEEVTRYYDHLRNDKALRLATKQRLLAEQLARDQAKANEAFFS